MQPNFVRITLFLIACAATGAIPGFARQKTAPPQAAPLPPVVLPRIPSRVFSITSYGAVGDGKTINTSAFEKAVAACAKAGGGTVWVPKGRFLTQPFSLASNLNFHLDDGATVLLTTDPKDYKVASPTPARRNRNGIEAVDCHDVSLTGSGTIDGQGGAWWPRYRKSYVLPAGAAPLLHRPYLVVFQRCSRVLVENVRLTNSPSFHLVPGQCQNVTIRNLKIFAPPNAPNTDGIDPSGWNFHIDHCQIDVDDDNIAIKPAVRITPDKPSCQNFLIENCTFLRGHGMSIGGQTPGGLSGLLVRNCSFNGTQAGIRLKAARGSGGLVENCVYEHLTMRNVKVPLYITSYYPREPAQPADDATQPVNAETPIWRNIRVRDVTITDCPEAGRMVGLPEMPISDVVLTRVRISADKGLRVFYAKNIQFEASEITVKNGPVVDGDKTGVTGLDAAPSSLPAVAP